MKSMVEKFNVEITRRHQLRWKGQPSLQVNESQNSEQEDMLKFPYREALGALMWTATMPRPIFACAVRAVARFWNPGLY